RAIAADDTVAGACSPQSGGTSVVDDEDRGDCCIAAFPRSPREDVQALDGFLDRSSRRDSGAGRRTEAGCVEGGVWCHGGAAAKGHCRLSALRSPAGQPAVVAREDHWTDRLELHPSGGARDRRRALPAIPGGALLARVVGAVPVALRVDRRSDSRSVVGPVCPAALRRQRAEVDPWSGRW